MNKTLKKYWNWYMSLNLLETIGFTIVSISATLICTITLIMSTALIGYMFQ